MDQRCYDIRGVVARIANAGCGVVLLLLLLAACARGPGSGQARPSSAPPLNLGGQRVLVLPVQSGAGLDRETWDAELLFALSERDPQSVWIGADELRRALRRAPAFAGDPTTLPADPLLHHGERRAVEPLAGQIRRYAALVDARLVLLPRVSLRAFPPAGASLQLDAALLDAHTGNVVWWSEGESGLDPEAGRAAVAMLSAALAQRLIAAPRRGES